MNVSIKLLTSGILLCAMSCAFAKGNPAASQCRHLSGLNAAQLQKVATSNPFWSSIHMQQLYLAVLHNAGGLMRSAGANGTLSTADRAAVTLGAIVMHDLPLLKQYYSGKANKYFIATTHTDVLYWAAMCNSPHAVTFLLKRGIDPNFYGGHGAGPFNVSLLYTQSRVPQLLLAHGYMISKHYNLCRSSKHIVARNRSHISATIAGDVDHAMCHDTTINQITVSGSHTGV